MAKVYQAIHLDIKTLSSRRLGKCGLSKTQLSRLGPRVKRISMQIERERREGQHKFRDLPYDRLTRQAVEALAKSLRPKTDNLVVLGIGGSALGTTALHTALNHAQYNLLSRRRRGGPRLFVMDNIDPDGFAATLDVLNKELPRTLFNVISKSGETVETAAQFMVIRRLLRKRLGAAQARKQIVVTTDSQIGTMREITATENYASLPVPEGVGGRFSVLSAVGLFPAAMCGIDVKAILKGAADMDVQVQSTALTTNPAAQFATVNYLYFRRGRPMTVMMAYSNALSGLVDWFRQLWAESLGKARNARGTKQLNVGPTPIRALGATDQHSQIQLYREGPNDKLITFLTVDEFEKQVRIPNDFSNLAAMSYLGGSNLGAILHAEKKATELALLESERPCMTLNIPKITPYTIGQFIYLMESATVFAAKLFDINPYDQPGVELGKQIAYHFLGRSGFENLKRILGSGGR